MLSVALDALLKELDSLSNTRKEQAEALAKTDTEITKIEQVLMVLDPNYKPTRSTAPLSPNALRLKRETQSGSGSFTGLVLNTLKEANRFIHIKEIYNILKGMGGRDTLSLDNISRALSNLKNRRANPHGIVTYRNGHVKFTYWGFERYMDGDKIKPEYAFMSISDIDAIELFDEKSHIDEDAA